MVQRRVPWRMFVRLDEARARSVPETRGLDFAGFFTAGLRASGALRHSVAV